MGILSGIFAILMFIFVLAALIGLIKPSLVKQKNRAKAFFIYLILAFFMMMAGALTMPSSSDSTKQIASTENDLEGQACGYEVIKADDYSFSGRKRVRWQIVAPKATTFRDRAYTAIQAAKDLYKETEADQVNVWMELHKDLTDKGYLYAMVTYTPDGKGNSGKESNGKIWDVAASKNQINDVQLNVAKEWYKNRQKFLDKDKNLDEQKLKKYLAETLALPENQITLPWIEKESFSYDDSSYMVAGSKSPSSVPNPESFSKTKCEMDLSCWAEKHLVDVAVKAVPIIEKSANYDYKWTDGVLSPKFSHYRWADMKNGTITYIGDKIQLQNGFGAWQNYVYECDYNPKSETILDLRMGVGRL